MRFAGWALLGLLGGFARFSYSGLTEFLGKFGLLNGVCLLGLAGSHVCRVKFTGSGLLDKVC